MGNPPDINAGRAMDDFQEQRARIVDYLTISIGLALVPISALVVSVAMRDGWTIGAPVQLTIFAVIWLLAWNRKLDTVEIRGSVVMLFLFLTALSEVYRYGLVTATYPMLAVLPILGTVVGGMRFGVASIGVVVLAIAAVAAVAVGEGRAPELAMPDYVLSPAEWSIRIVNVAIAAGIGVFVTGTLYQFHQDSNLALRGRNTELAKSQARVVQSAKLAGLGYAIADVRTGEVKECDDRYAEMHGMSVGDFLSSKGRSDVLEGILLAEPEAERPLDRLLRGEALIADSRHVLPDGESRYIQKIFSPLNPGDPDDHRFEVVGQDVTETRTLQEQLFQTQKLDAIGKLTGGVAHDFNNLLAVILGNLELLQDEIAASDQTELLSNALEATVAGSQLTRSMLSFARRAQLAPSRVDLNHLVRNLRDWTGRTLPSTIDVEVALQEDLWPIDIDATSAESGLLNLIVNARDAMPRGGRLTIATSNLHVDAASASLRGEDV
ncbi:MAG: histidine kinase dimerization/phospho-acceptor domain-containing protein, partial [Myxococcota bacterium]